MDSKWGTFHPNKPPSISALQISTISRSGAGNQLCPHKFSQLILYSIFSIDASSHILTSSFSASSINIECLSEQFYSTTTSCITLWIKLTPLSEIPESFYIPRPRKTSKRAAPSMQIYRPTPRPLASVTAHARARRVKRTHELPARQRSRLPRLCYSISVNAGAAPLLHAHSSPCCAAVNRTPGSITAQRGAEKPPALTSTLPLFQIRIIDFAQTFVKGLSWQRNKKSEEPRCENIFYY